MDIVNKTDVPQTVKKAPCRIDCKGLLLYTIYSLESLFWAFLTSGADSFFDFVMNP